MKELHDPPLTPRELEIVQNYDRTINDIKLRHQEEKAALNDKFVAKALDLARSDSTRTVTLVVSIIAILISIGVAVYGHKLP